MALIICDGSFDDWYVIERTDYSRVSDAERAERERDETLSDLTAERMAANEWLPQWHDAKRDLTTARALLRECLEGREDCDDLTCSATKLCEFCDLTARIEAHLEGR